MIPHRIIRRAGAALLAVALLGAGLAGGGALTPAPAFADPFANAAFQALWQRTDLPVAQGKAARSWLWGNQPLTTQQEPYTEGAAGSRQVQYFDKSRMEINNPAGDPNSPWYVTNGLLVVEMMTGQIQTGNNSFQASYPSNIAVAGDPDDVAQTAPTYAALARVMNVFYGGTPEGGIPPGTPIQATIDKNGNYTPAGGPANLATDAAFIPQTRHNIPDVFWSFLNSSGLVYQNGQFVNGAVMNWVYVTGYPITEPYWATIRVGGVNRQVLVQAFQRRILTYSPTNPPGWQVEMGNAGRAYYTWRFEHPTCAAAPVRGFGVAWAQNPALAHTIGCPVPWQTEQSVTTAVERFQHGTMLYVAATNHYPYPGPSIFVMFADGSYQRFDDTYVEGQANVCSPSPVPVGFVVPQRGFNKVWCEGSGVDVRGRLGWALAPEQGGAGAWQEFAHGYMFWTGASNQIFAFLGLHPGDTLPPRWLSFANTFQP